MRHVTDPMPRDRPTLLPPDGALLVAGSSGAERQPPRRDVGSAAWHQPEHIRDRAAARRRLEAAAFAGADVIVAPAYRTHRRALSLYGETRRASEWTRAAVEFAREAAELAQERAAQAEADPTSARDIDDGSGREGRRGLGDGDRSGGRDDGSEARHPGRRDDGSSAAPSAADERTAAPPPPRRTDRALVAGPMGPLETGRFEAALDPGVIADEDRERADLLVDAGADLLVVEPMPSLVEARSAALAAAATGMPVWVGLQIAPSGIHLPSGDALEAVWQELAGLRPEAVVIAPSSPSTIDRDLDLVRRIVDVPIGLWLDAGGPDWTSGNDRVDAWLDGVTRVLGLASGATSERIRRVRGAMDRRLAVAAERHMAEQRAWLTAVDDAATRTGGGRAAWVGRSAPANLPPTFDWTVVAGPSALRLSEPAFGLIVVVDPDDPEQAVAQLGRAVEDGGYLLARSTAPLETVPDGLSVRSIESVAGAAATLLRRDR
jgi:methionine synthase I (cobalamin-dependent)